MEVQKYKVDNEIMMRNISNIYVAFEDPKAEYKLHKIEVEDNATDQPIIFSLLGEIHGYY